MVCALIWGAYWTAYCRWYSYNLYKRAFLFYKFYVVKKGYTYQSYCKIFISEHEYLKLRGKRHVAYTTLLDMLVDGKPLIDKYFTRNSFSRKDYSALVNDWYKFQPRKSLKTLRECICLENKKKDDLMLKINDYFRIHRYNIEVSIFIRAMRINGYLFEKEKNETIYKAIEQEYHYDLRERSGMNKPLNPNLNYDIDDPAKELARWLKI
jgi:hypothetical protein